jgi:hypothetical protein
MIERRYLGEDMNSQAETRAGRQRKFRLHKPSTLDKKKKKERKKKKMQGGEEEPKEKYTVGVLAWNVLDLVNVLEQLVFGLEKPSIHKVMRFYPGECQCERAGTEMRAN